MNYLRFKKLFQSDNDGTFWPGYIELPDENDSSQISKDQENPSFFSSNPRVVTGLALIIIVAAMFMFSSSHSQVGETSDILPWRQKFESETKVNVYHTFAQCNIIFATEMISCLFPKSNSGSLLDFSD